ncbi:MAG: DUF1707 domain-containing protein [Chloroflexi bacterium]|nr:MAG: DUF1707 domain-containing protein [Chloroflexota bacterium]TME14577.1 MAG: DUF1707 domain-containing protein [Chloroflexota bacterium]TME20593.1 MAG: DUF1707 domain-containing protein [Chloroflexota bacterium]
MLASDADRDRVLQLLKEHYVAGRLTHDDLAGRIGETIKARTLDDLQASLRDLPSAPLPSPLPPRPVPAPAPYLVTPPLPYVHRSRHWGRGYRPWTVWPLLWIGFWVFGSHNWFAAGVMVPLLLIGGGCWLLLRGSRPRPERSALPPTSPARF